MPATSRWTGLIGIAVGNALPLFLVWSGQLTITDLVLVYFLELVLSFLVLFAALPRRDALKNVFMMLLGAAVVTPAIAIPTLRHVTWDLTTLSFVGVALVSSLVGYVASIWRRREQWRTGLFGAFAWRLMLMIVALAAASAGSSYEKLLAAGWEPHSFGRGWALPAGELMAKIVVALDTPAVIVAAGILCSYRLVSEVLYEVFDIFRDEAGEARTSR